MSMLDVQDVSVRFGGIVALDGLSFTIDDGQICGLIGPNGAGKTTMFNVISRIYDASEGRVLFRGKELLTAQAHDIAKLGIARTFQNLALFPTMTLLENVMVGAHSQGTAGFWRSGLRIGMHKYERQLRDEAGDLLKSLQLDHLAFRPAAGLPFGTLKRLEIARALAARPTFLLMDEPASGLTHSEVDELSETIKRVRDEFKLAVLLVEHHMAMVMGHLRQGRRDGVRSQDRRGTAGRRAEQRASHRRLPRDNGMTVLLDVKDLVAGYGAVQVLHGLDLQVQTGEVAVILGANGAGKTTTMRAISGMISRKGAIEFEGRSLATMSANDIVRAGVAQVPQGRGTFTDLSVEDNMRAGAYSRKGGDVAADMKEWYDIFPRLHERREQKAGSLSGGEQQMLAISRALMSKPKLLLCDEPSLGLAPIITQELFAILGRLNAERGLSILVVEQNANLAMKIAHSVFVLETGTIVASGTSAEIANDDAVRKAYLGY